MRNTSTTQTLFLESLAQNSHRYSWKYVDNKIVGIAKRGKYRKQVFNPVTAVAESLGFGYFDNNKRGTQRAAKAIGITQELALAIYSPSNRGHAQIVRGKMLQTLF